AIFNISSSNFIGVLSFNKLKILLSSLNGSALKFLGAPPSSSKISPLISSLMYREIVSLTLFISLANNSLSPVSLSNAVASCSLENVNSTNFLNGLFEYTTPFLLSLVGIGDAVGLKSFVSLTSVASLYQLEAYFKSSRLKTLNFSTASSPSTTPLLITLSYKT